MSEESVFSALSESIGVGAFLWRPGGGLTVNHSLAALLGCRPDELAERELPDLVPGPDREAIARTMSEVLSGAQEFGRVVMRAVRKDGTLVELRGEVRRALLAGQGVLVGSLVRDTAREAAGMGSGSLGGAIGPSAQLASVQRLESIGRLAGGISHDFNNYLTVIMGYSEMLLTQGPLSPAQRESLSEVQKAASRASSLTGQLLAFSRRQVLQPAKIRLDERVAEAGRMLRRVIGEDVEIHHETDPSLWAVFADPGQVDQVLLNLAVNARDAMPTGGQITIRVRNVVVGPALSDEQRLAGQRPGPYVSLTVTDTGIGMDAETAAQIFEPFFTTKERGKGTGLGLSTVYGIVKQSGGFIWVKSELGRGTTFEIQLPRCDAAPAEVGTSSDELRTMWNATETILLVEDEAAVRRLVGDTLRRRGFTVLSAGGAEEAMSLARAHSGPLDLLLTDLVMPGAGGRELADRLREERPSLRVLFMTGYSDDAIPREGMDPGAIILQKPFSSGRLLRRVRRVLTAAIVRPGGPGDGASGAAA